NEEPSQPAGFFVCVRKIWVFASETSMRLHWAAAGLIAFQKKYSMLKGAPAICRAGMSSIVDPCHQ
ncbi:hypothetical protein, partial [Halomonas hibernica]|uniref:hypothetical protein n=1 Tax=Halomonas hibernica TaxID=2591147 RepID=UPI001C12F66A